MGDVVPLNLALKARRYVDGEQVRQEINGEFVILSLVVATFGAYTALTTTSFLKHVRDRIWYWVLVAQAGLALGVCTIWGMHFVPERACL